MFAGVNGLLIPGGATSIFHSGYADASNAFFQMAKEVLKACIFSLGSEISFSFSGKFGWGLLPNLGNLSWLRDDGTDGQ